MKKNLLYLLLLSLFAAACEVVDTEMPVYPVKDKTVLVYMVANNNLSSDAVTNLNGLMNGYIPDNGNIVVYYHTFNSTPLLLNLHKDKEGRTAVDTAYRFPEMNSATTKSLASAMKITRTLYPAEEYGLFLWSHGTGWLPKGYFAHNNRQAVLSEEARPDWEDYPGGIDPYAHMVKSFGAEEGVEMEITDLAKSLPYRLSYVIFDACLMGGVEVAYELKDSVDYVVASPCEILTDGFPYGKVMQHLFKDKPDLEATAEEFYNYYNAQNGDYRSATISVVETAALEKVAQAVRPLFDKYRGQIGLLDATAVQRYFRGNKRWFYDLGDFIGKLAAPEEAAPVLEALNAAVLYKAATPYFLDIPIDPQSFSGLSIYIPTAPTDPKLDDFYKTFKWNHDAQLIQDAPPVAPDPAVQGTSFR